MKHCLLLIVLLVLAYPQPAHAYSVQVCSDHEVDLAIADARVGDTIRFSCSGTIAITTTIILYKDVTLDGTGQNLIFSGGTQPMFSINANVGVTLNHLSFTSTTADASISNDGILTVIDSTFTGNGGTAIRNSENATLTLTNATFVNNPNGYFERAVYNFRGTVTVNKSTFTGNNHGILNLNGTLTVHDSTFADNHGTGLYNNSKLTVTGSTFSANNHGIDNDSGDVLVVNSTFANNHTITPQGIGAGIANRGTVFVINSTFSGNIADSGGAIGSHFGGIVTLQNSIIANSSLGWNCFGPIIDGGHNLQFPGTTCGTTMPSADPKLLSLADNGGATQTINLQAGSPAEGHGNRNICAVAPVTNVDQRGLPRILSEDDTCDIGAVESSIDVLLRPVNRE